MPFLNKTTPSPEGKRKKKHSSDTVINNQEENADLENISPRLPNINRSIRSVNSGVRRRSIGHHTLPPTGNGWLEELYSGDYGETHDDFLHDNARQKIISVGAEPNSEVSVARMISRMAWRVMNRVVTELILEVLPVKGISVFRGHYDELCAKGAGKILSGKLRRRELV